MSKTLKILITGAARGIGRATAQVLANRRHSVVATDIKSLEAKDVVDFVLHDTSRRGRRAAQLMATVLRSFSLSCFKRVAFGKTFLRPFPRFPTDGWPIFLIILNPEILRRF